MIIHFSMVNREVLFAANHLQNQIAVVLTSVSFCVSRANEMALSYKNQNSSYWDKFQ